jgi:hypothetical protein
MNTRLEASFVKRATFFLFIKTSHTVQVFLYDVDKPIGKSYKELHIIRNSRLVLFVFMRFRISCDFITLQNSEPQTDKIFCEVGFPASPGQENPSYPLAEKATNYLSTWIL